MVPPEETSAIVPGLEEGKDYEFRVVPVNAAGKGESSDPTASIFTKARKGLYIQTVLLTVSLLETTCVVYSD